MDTHTSWDFVKMQTLIHKPGVSWGVCLSDELPSDADVVGTWVLLCAVRCRGNEGATGSVGEGAWK